MENYYAYTLWQQRQMQMANQQYVPGGSLAGELLGVCQKAAMISVNGPDNSISTEQKLLLVEDGL